MRFKKIDGKEVASFTTWTRVHEVTRRRLRTGHYSFRCSCGFRGRSGRPATNGVAENHEIDARCIANRAYTRDLDRFLAEQL